MPSKLTIVWKQNELPIDGQLFTLKSGVAIRFVTLRLGQYQSTIGSFYAECRGNFRNAFVADYNALGEYTVTYGGATDLYIEHPNSGHFVQGQIALPANGIDIATVVDTPDAVPISVTNVSYAQAGDACNKVLATVTTSSLATTVTSPVSIPNNTDNPFTFEYTRGAFINISGRNAQQETFSHGTITPGRLMEASMSVAVVNAPNGSTATGSIPLPTGTTLEWSINDIAYQASNTFTNLIPGSYTMYVRDTLGCKVSKTFTVTEFESEGVGVTAPIADLPSKLNSIRFYRKKADGDYSIDENVMNCETPYVNARFGTQKFKNSDEIRTQIRSNYENLTMTVSDSLGNDYDIPAQKVTDNVGKNDSRDATIYGLENGQSAIFFTSGQKYIYGTSTPDGAYSLNGALPAWGRLGNFVAIGLGWYEIVDIAYSDEKNAEVLIVDFSHDVIEEVIQVSSIYNAQDYEVYEFLIDFSLFQDRFVQVVIDETDSKGEYSDVQFRSDIIQVADSFHKHVTVEWWNKENSGGIMYSTGITHKANLPLIYSKGISIEDSDSDTTDSSAYLIESSVHEGDEFKFGWMAKEMWRKLVYAVNHDYWSVDGVMYVKNAEVEENHLSLSNQYAPTIIGIKSDSAYSSKPTGDGNATPIELPNLIKSDGNYIKYK